MKTILPELKYLFLFRNELIMVESDEIESDSEASVEIGKQHSSSEISYYMPYLTLLWLFKL